MRTSVYLPMILITSMSPKVAHICRGSCSPPLPYFSRRGEEFLSGTSIEDITTWDALTRRAQTSLLHCVPTSRSLRGVQGEQSSRAATVHAQPAAILLQHHGVEHRVFADTYPLCLAVVPQANGTSTCFQRTSSPHHRAEGIWPPRGGQGARSGRLHARAEPCMC